MKNIVVTLIALVLIGGVLAVSVSFDTPEEGEAAIQDPVFYNELGFKLSQEGNYEAAVAAFETAVRLNPSYERARVNLATAAYHAGQYLKAVEHLSVLIETAPSAEYHFDMAQNLVAQARFAETDVDKALAQLEQALIHLHSAEQLSPGFPHAAENAEIVVKVLAEF